MMRMTCEWVSERPDGLMGDMASHYKVRLFHGGKQMTLYYSMGAAHTKPELDDILSCLVSDSWDFVGGDPGFEEWAGNYGYDTDSREAESIYLETAKQAAKFLALCGDDFEKIAKSVEDH